MIWRIVLVGFAAETQDLIVANPVPQSFGSEMNQATLIARDGAVTKLPPMLKEDLAEKVLDFVAEKLSR